MSTSGPPLGSYTPAEIPWEEIEAQLRAAVDYWLVTTRPDGRPHVVPRWGVWLDGRFWYDGAATTVHARNLAVHPACALHLEDGAQAVVVEGSSSPARAAAGRAAARARARPPRARTPARRAARPGRRGRARSAARPPPRPRRAASTPAATRRSGPG